MRLWKREDELERRLRSSRPEPRTDLVRALAGLIDEAPRPRAMRFALAAILTAVALAAFGAFGGLSYAGRRSNSAPTNRRATARGPITRIRTRAMRKGTTRATRRARTTTTRLTTSTAGRPRSATAHRRNEPARAHQREQQRGAGSQAAARRHAAVPVGPVPVRLSLRTKTDRLRRPTRSVGRHVFCGYGRTCRSAAGSPKCGVAPSASASRESAVSPSPSQWRSALRCSITDVSVWTRSARVCAASACSRSASRSRASRSRRAAATISSACSRDFFSAASLSRRAASLTLSAQRSAE